MRKKQHLPTLAVIVCLLFGCSSMAPAAGTSRSLVTRIPPIYPDLARKMHVGGVVVVHVTIQPNGTVSETKVESGHPLLAAAAQDAVRRWRYAASTDVSEGTVEVKFDLGGGQ